MCARHEPASSKGHPLAPAGNLPLPNCLTENREFAGLIRERPAHCRACLHASPHYGRLMIAPGAAMLLLGLILILAALIQAGACLARPVEPLTIEPAGTLAEVLRDPAIYDGLPTERCYQPRLTSGLWEAMRAWLIILFGAITAAAGFYLNRMRIAAEGGGDTAARLFSPGVILSGERMSADAVTGRPPLPLNPISDGIEVCETLRAEIRLSAEGESVVRLKGPLQGEINPHLRFMPQDRQRVRQYQSRYGLKDQKYIPFRAGYLALVGRPLAHFAMRPSRRNLLWLSGQVGEHAYLMNQAGERFDLAAPHKQQSIYPDGGERKTAAEWPITWRYNVPLEDQSPESLPGLAHEQADWKNVPLRLLPLVEMDDARRVRLQVQFDPTGFPFLGPGHKLVVEEIKILLDHRLGKPQTRTPGVITDTVPGSVRSASCYQVEWRGLQYAVEEGVTSFELPEIYFPQPLHPGARLKGQLRLRVPAARSGLSGVQYFSAAGRRSRGDHDGAPLTSQEFTTLEIEFDLALDHLPHTDLVTRAAEMDVPGALNPARLRRLLYKVSTLDCSMQVDGAAAPTESEYTAAPVHLRHVVEDAQAGEHVTRPGRSRWDISGRRYHQHAPVDLHLVIYEETSCSPGNAAEPRCASHVEIIVRGQVSETENSLAVYSSGGSVGNLSVLEKRLGRERSGVQAVEDTLAELEQLVSQWAADEG